MNGGIMAKKNFDNIAKMLKAAITIMNILSTPKRLHREMP